MYVKKVQEKKYEEKPYEKCMVLRILTTWSRFADTIRIMKIIIFHFIFSR